ncbi:hypothetical protein BGX38DRAFT_1184083, partial [Terfezia claveryi]
GKGRAFVEDEKGKVWEDEGIALLCPGVYISFYYSCLSHFTGTFPSFVSCCTPSLLTRLLLGFLLIGSLTHTYMDLAFCYEST